MIDASRSADSPRAGAGRVRPACPSSPDIGNKATPRVGVPLSFGSSYPRSTAMQAAPHTALTHAPWQGSLTLTAAERASLRVDRIVTDELIDDLLPTVEYIAFFGPMQIDAETRRAWEAEARRQADTASAFCALLDNPTRLGYSYFVGRWIARGLPREDAERRFAHLLSDLEELEAHLRHHANATGASRGNKADTQVDHLVRGAAASWRRHTGQQPGTGESSAFVKFCLALGALAELTLTRERIRAVINGGL